jgi:histone-lysine N-methyltransferase SETMAR
MKISEQCLDHLNKNKTDFMHRFITMDETWIHHYTPESKQQSKQWTEAGCSAPKKRRSVPSARKVMASVFWDAEGILFIDYLEKGKIITGEYYSNLLTRLDEKVREKRPGLQKKNIIFHQDNAPAHKIVLAMGKLRDLHYELLKHPIYSPDLAPSDFFLFPKLNSFSLVSVFLRVKRRLQL